jgi:PAS domain S-box-containing protein
MSQWDNLALKLRVSEGRAAAIHNASLDAIVLMDREGRFLDYNPAAEIMFGYERAEVLGRPIADFIIPPALRERHYAGLERYLATGAGPVVNQRVELPALRANGEIFPIELAVAPIEEDDLIFVGFIRDISDRKQAEQRQAFLMNELSHRSKNLLAVVQAIVHRALKDHAPAEARDIIDRRITALARSHSALAINPIGAPLSQIIKDELDGFSNRIAISGPEIYLRASAAQTMALILHELATNAVKHGALASEAGRVNVNWTLSGDDVPTLVFEWRERGGPLIAQPTRSGFGRTVLEHIAASEFKRVPVMSFASEGLSYRLEAALDTLVDDSGV